MQQTEAIPAKPKRQHFLALDFLRGIAALAVVILHWLEGLGNPWFHNARLAVDFFFLLSGFVMVYSYEERLREGLSLGRFFLLRLIRLYPMILIGILLGGVRFVMRGAVTHDLDLHDILAKLALNLFMLPDVFTSLNADMFPLNIALWSLFFEFIAYIAFGLFTYRLRNWALGVIVVLSGAIVLSWLFNEVPPQPAPGFEFRGVDGLGYIFSFGRVMFSFTLGMLAFRLRDRFPWAPKLNAWTYAIGLMALFAVPEGVFSPLAVMALLSIVFPLVILLVARTEVSGATKTAGTFFGDLSYPLYVVHTPLLWIFGGAAKIVGVDRFHIPEITLGLVIVPVTAVIAYAICKVYDEPVRRALTRLYRHSTDPRPSL